MSTDDKMLQLDNVSIRLVKERILLSDYPLNTPANAVRFVSEILREYDREVICTVGLNNSLNAINMSICSMGVINQAISTPREVMKSLILSNSSAFIMLHTHPGGTVTPSIDDIRITDRIAKAGELLNIPLYDHVITAAGTDEIYSFYAENAMPDTKLSYTDNISEIKLMYKDKAKLSEQEVPHKTLHI